LRRSLTGIKPSGQIHVGNYLGSVRPALELQRSFDAFSFIADYHALTQVEDAAVLQDRTHEVAATFLALGLDPERNVLYRQSAVPEVHELAWVLSCVIPVGMLDRGHAVKAARDGGREINAGTLFYPVLMAADILLYDANVVPVGKDQKQHVEMARDMAIKVNHRAEGTLVVPEVVIQEDVATVPGLDGRKMSKSYDNVIPLWAAPKELRKLVMRIKTDSRGVEDVKDPDTCPVFQLYRAFAEPDQVADLRARYLAPGLGYGHAKQALFEAMEATLAAPRERYTYWREHPADLEDVLSTGAARARAIATPTLHRVRRAFGLEAWTATLG
jgi:tryptophanyl-tRNA synthetase